MDAPYRLANFLLCQLAAVPMMASEQLTGATSNGYDPAPARVSAAVLLQSKQCKRQDAQADSSQKPLQCPAPSILGSIKNCSCA